tara:strand:+ start:2180 stop:3208 length:1029 start_codon:yes stop_codon:yes gene_type:complete
LFTQYIANPITNIRIHIEDFLYYKKDNAFTFLSIVVHILFLLPMISLTFNKDKITDIPLILPVEMFIVEETTVAPEFDQEINEIVPDRVQEEEINEALEETVEEVPIIDEVIEEIEEIIEDPPLIEPPEEIIIANDSMEVETDFVIDQKIIPEEVVEEKPTKPINDFEIKLKEKPEPREIIEEPEVEIVVKKKPKKKSFNISKVLKDIENESKDFKEIQEETKEKQEDVFTEQVGKKMTISELELLKQQLYSCYTVPAGAKELEDIKVQVQIIVNEDRTVKEAKIKNTSKMNTDPYFRTAGEAALRAFNHPDCSTLMLPEDKYKEWKEINFTFDFSWMFDNS